MGLCGRLPGDHGFRGANQSRPDLEFSLAVIYPAKPVLDLDSRKIVVCPAVACQEVYCEGVCCDHSRDTEMSPFSACCPKGYTPFGRGTE